MSDSPPKATPPEASRSAASWLAVAGYFVVFFAAMVLGGLLFLLGGVAIVLIPGALPMWVEVAYVAFGIVGSVTIALIAANGAFRLSARHRSGRPDGVGDQAAPRKTSALAWVAGVVGTVVASVLSAVLGALILNWLDQ